MQLIQVIDAARVIINDPLSTARTFPDNTSSFWTDNALTTYHNLVQSELQNELIQSFENFFVTQTTLNLVGGSADVALPTDFIQAIRVEDIRGNPTSPVEVLPITIGDRGALDYLPMPSAVTVNNGYYIVGNRVHFGFTPTTSQQSAIRLFYVKRLPDVTSATDSSEIPTEYHMALVWGVVKYALFQQQSDTTRADLEYEKLISKIRKQSEDRQIQRPRKVRIRQGMI